MPTTHPLPLIISTNAIRIAGLNRDRTRKTSDSFTTYDVHFELSEAPPVLWRDIFGREWNDVNSVHDATIDGRFLVIRCPLQEIDRIHLPMLKKAVDATNEAYARYLQEQASEQERTDNDGMPASLVRRTTAIHRAEQERKTVDDLAGVLEFA